MQGGGCPLRIRRGPPPPPQRSRRTHDRLVRGWARWGAKRGPPRPASRWGGALMQARMRARGLAHVLSGAGATRACPLCLCAIGEPARQVVTGCRDLCERARDRARLGREAPAPRRCTASPRARKRRRTSARKAPDRKLTARTARSGGGGGSSLAHPHPDALVRFVAGCARAFMRWSAGTRAPCAASRRADAHPHGAREGLARAPELRSEARGAARRPAAVYRAGGDAAARKAPSPPPRPARTRPTPGPVEGR